MSIPLDLEVPQVLTVRYPELFGVGPGSATSYAPLSSTADPAAPRLPTLSVGEFILFVDYDMPTSGLEANVLLLKHTSPPEAVPECSAGSETSLFVKPQNPVSGSELNNAADSARNSMQLRVNEAPKRLWRLGQVVNVIAPTEGTLFQQSSFPGSPPFLSPTTLKSASSTGPTPTVEGFLNSDNSTVQYEVVKYGLVPSTGSVVDALSLTPIQKKSLVCKQVPQNHFLDFHHRALQTATVGATVTGPGSATTVPPLARPMNPPGAAQGGGAVSAPSASKPATSQLTLDIDQLIGESASKSASPRQRSRSPGTNGVSGSGVGTPLDGGLEAPSQTVSVTALKSHASSKLLEAKSSRARLGRSRGGGLGTSTGDDGGDERASLKRQSSSIGEGAGNRFHLADFPRLDQSNLVFVPLYSYPSSSSNETVATHQSSTHRLHEYPSTLDMLEGGATDGFTVRSFLHPHSPLSRPSVVTGNNPPQPSWNQDHRTSVFASKSMESVTLGKSHGGFSASQSTEKIIVGGTPVMPIGGQQHLGSFLPGSPLTGFGTSYGAATGPGPKNSSIAILSISSNSQSQSASSGEVSGGLDVPMAPPRLASPLFPPPAGKHHLSPALSRSFNAMSLSFGTKLALQNVVGVANPQRHDSDNPFSSASPKPDPIPITVKISHRQVLLRNVSPLLIDFLVAPSEKKPTSTEGDILPVPPPSGGGSRSPADPNLATVSDATKLLTAPKKPSRDRRNSSLNRTGRYNDLSNTMKSRTATPQESMGSPSSLLNAASQRDLKKKPSTMDLNGTLTKVKLTKAQTAAFIPREMGKLLAALAHAMDQVALIQQRMNGLAGTAGSGGFSGLGSGTQPPTPFNPQQPNDASQSARLLGSRRTLAPSQKTMLLSSGGSNGDSEQPPINDRRRSSDMIMMIPSVLSAHLGVVGVGGQGEPAPLQLPQFLPPSFSDGEGESRRLSVLGGPPRALGSTLKPSLFPSGVVSPSLSNVNSSATGSASSAHSQTILQKLVEKQIGSKLDVEAKAMKKSAREVKEGTTDRATLDAGQGSRLLQISGINIREVEERASIFSLGAEAASALAAALARVVPPPTLALRDPSRQSFDGTTMNSPNLLHTPFGFGQQQQQRRQVLDSGNTLHVARFGAVKLSRCLEALNAPSTPMTRRNTLNSGVGTLLAGSGDDRRRSTIGFSGGSLPLSPSGVFPPPRPSGGPGQSSSQRRLNNLVVTFVAYETDETDWLELSQSLTSVPLLSDLQSFHLADISALQNLLPEPNSQVEGNENEKISPANFQTAGRKTLNTKAMNATFATLVQGWLSPNQPDRVPQEPDFSLAKATLVEAVFSRVAVHISHVTQDSNPMHGHQQGDEPSFLRTRTILWQKINVSHLTSLTLSGVHLEYLDLKPFMTLPLERVDSIGSCSMALPCLLQHLDLSDNNLDDEFATVLAAWLPVCAPDSPSKLTRRLSPRSGQELTEGAKDETQKGQVVARPAGWSIQTLKLSKNPISEDGIFALSQAMLNAPVSCPLHFIELACVRCPPQVVGNLLEPCRVPDHPAGWTLRHHPRTEKRQRRRLRLIAFAVTRGAKSVTKRDSIADPPAGQSRVIPDKSRETGAALQHLLSFFSVFARPSPMTVVY